MKGTITHFNFVFAAYLVVTVRGQNVEMQINIDITDQNTAKANQGLSKPGISNFAIIEMSFPF